MQGPLKAYEIYAAQRQRKLTDFVASSTKKLWKLNCSFLVSWLTTTSLCVLQITLLTIQEQVSRFRNKYRGHTRTKHMLNEQITSHLNKELLLTRWYGSAWNGMSDEDDNFLPVLDKDSELIATSLLDRPNIKSGSY